MTMKRRVIVVGIMLALGLAACGDDAGDTTVDDPGDTTVEDPAETTPEEPPAEEPGGATVAVADTDLGEVLVDDQGMTLYLFEPDEQSASTCEDECAANWPPFLTDGDPAAGEGADAALLGTTERPDGTTQVTYDGWPLYHFGADEAPGDTNGQGINDVWWMVGPDGEARRD